MEIRLRSLRKGRAIARCCRDREAGAWPRMRAPVFSVPEGPWRLAGGANHRTPAREKIRPGGAAERVPIRAPVSSVAPRRGWGLSDFPWVETHGYHRAVAPRRGELSGDGVSGRGATLEGSRAFQRPDADPVNSRSHGVTIEGCGESESVSNFPISKPQFPFH